MQSKKSFFSFGLFSKNIKRFWPMWTIISIIGLVFDFVTWSEMRLSFIYSNANRVSASELYYGLCAYVVPVASFVYALIAAMAVWGFLFKQKADNFMRMLPISSISEFVSTFLSGLVIMLIPYVVTYAVLVPMLAVMCGATWKAVFSSLFVIVANTLFYFSVATLIAQIGAAFPILYVLLHFIVPLSDVLINLYAGGFLPGGRASYSGRLEFLSPIFYMLKRGDDCVYRDNNYFAKEFTAFGMKMTLIYMLAGIVLLALACFLFTRRKAESTGDVLAFEPLKPVFHIYLTIIGTILGTYIIYELLGRHEVVRNSCVSTLCSIAPLLICFFGLLMILKKTKNVFSKRTWTEFGIMFLMVFIVNEMLSMDTFGLGRKLPDMADVKEIYYHSNEAGSIHIDPLTEPELVNEVNDILYCIYDEKAYDIDSYKYCTQYVRVEYLLKNGSCVSKSYQILDSSNAKSMLTEATAKVENFEGSTKIKLKSIEYEKRNQLTYSIDMESVIDYFFINIEMEDTHDLIEAIAQDITEGTVFSNSYDEDIIGNLSLYFYEKQPGDPYHKYAGNTTIYLNPYMTNTINYLDSKGYLKEVFQR